MAGIPIHYHIFTHTNRPSKLAANEDAVLAADEVRQGNVSECGEIAGDQSSLFAVSDGLHATPSAAYASRTLLTQLAAIWKTNAGLASGQKIEQLQGGFCDAAMGHPEREGMACTLVAAEIRDSRALVYHVGDSRAWLIRQRRVTRLTRDHTALEWLFRAGEIASAEADEYASVYGALDNYFMASPFEEPPEHDRCELTLEAGGMLLLASDGISNLDEDAISACVNTHLATMVNALFEASVAAGSDDNISIIVVRFGSDEIVDTEY